MRELFVDTSGWAAWIDSHEQFHPRAVAACDSIWQANGRLVTTNWVLVELTALLTSPLRVTKPRQIELLEDIRADSSVVVIPIDSQMENDAWQLWKARPDKAWTLNDCASFVAMSRRGLSEALTADHHFEQAGFIRMLK